MPSRSKEQRVYWVRPSTGWQRSYRDPRPSPYDIFGGLEVEVFVSRKSILSADEAPFGELARTELVALHRNLPYTAERLEKD
jgi:hypothetical protein